mmetsp:Transcript_25997/g.46001  ORF Transcript_25997/g.46001 Transcript_25997/m.46001 type:complete len:173 (-) Transcript_25997:1374-1892(-)
MEDLVNMSLSDVIQKEKAKRKFQKKKEGHAKANVKHHEKPKGGPAKLKQLQQKQKVKPNQKPAKAEKPNKPNKPNKQNKPAQQAAPKEAKEGKEGKRKLFIKNLHLKADNTTLFKHFKQFGTMTRCGVNWDQLGKSKGTAIVQYEEAGNAAKALKASNGVELKGQAIEVSYS